MQQFHKIYYLTFMCGSTYFRRLSAHHQERKTALGASGFTSYVSRQSAHEGGKVVSPMHRAAFTPSKHSWYLFLLEAKSIISIMM